ADEDGVRIERSRVGEAATEVCGVVLVYGRGTERQLQVGRSGVVNQYAGGCAAAGSGIIRDGHTDAKGRGAAGFVEVLVADAAEVDNAGSQIQAAGAAVAPVDGDGVSVQRTRVGEAAAQGGGAVFVDGRSAQRQLDIGRRDIVDHDAGSGAGAGAIV